jgi:hypothetical protein
MMESDSRPNPDELLARVKAEEERKKRGKLKIFLGYSAGVGKTFAMLEAARLQKGERELVVAYVDTHGRPETEALVEGLEIVPRKRVEYRGVTPIPRVHGTPSATRTSRSWWRPGSMSIPPSTSSTWRACGTWFCR